MNIEAVLKKDGIIVLNRLDTLKVNSIAKSISEKLCSTFPTFNLNQNHLFVKLCRLNMYYAKMEEGMAEANYYYKNSSIYFNENIDLADIEEFAIHECIHFLQEVKDKKNCLIRMGLCDYTEFKAYGLALNEAAVQLMASKIINIPNESVKYFGIDFTTNSPSYYPLECFLVNQLAYLVGEDVLFKSTLYSNDDFKIAISKVTSKKTFIAIENALDNILNYEEKIIKLNNKIIKIDDRNAKVDNMISKIDALKNEIKITFMRTQNLILSSYFNSEFNKITNLQQIELYRKNLYSFRDCVGTTDGYTFFDDFYIQKISDLNHKANIIENGGTETAINIRLEENKNKLFILIRKLKYLIFGKVFNKEEQKNDDY